MQPALSIKKGDPNAHFWIRRSGSVKSVGEVLKDYNPDALGVTVDIERVYPKYAYYYFLHIFNSGLYHNVCVGSIALQHIKARDVQSFWRFV